MNYQRIYDSIINNAKLLEESRKLQKKQRLNYFERHHIIPKCLGGSNDESNLVYLTAKEHYLCHRLLVEIHPGDYRLKFAIWQMLHQTKLHKRYIPSGKIYERIKNEYAVSRLGVPKSTETKLRMSRSATGRIMSEETKRKLSIINTGKKLSAETIAKMSNTLRGMKKSEETRRRMTKPKPIVACPHCGVTGGQNTMVQWHFDKCKSLPGNEHIHDIRTNTLHECPKCGTKSTSLSNMKRYHFENCGKKVDIRKCPYCSKEMDARNAKKYHFDNCKLKNLEL